MLYWPNEEGMTLMRAYRVVDDLMTDDESNGLGLQNWESGFCSCCSYWDYCFECY